MSKEEDKGKIKTWTYKAELSLTYLIFSQCTPRNRRWETTQQKCDNCKKHDGAPFGPSYKKKDDPFCQEEDSIRDAEDQSQAPIIRPSHTVHSAGYCDRHNKDEISLVTEESNGQRKRKFASDTRSDGFYEGASPR